SRLQPATDVGFSKTSSVSLSTRLVNRAATTVFMCRLQEDPTGPRFFLREQIFKAIEEIPGSRCIPMQQDATCVEDLDRGNTSRILLTAKPSPPNPLPRFRKPRQRYNIN
ncbi:hypothetical protein KUCAC02_020315, partial [Chaenocephalus aceratus]